MCDKIRKLLAEQVPIAFTTIEYPGDDNIVLDNNSPYPEVMETLNSFKGKHWSQLTTDVIVLNVSHLPYLTLPAFCFYFPAYLLTIATYTGYTDQLLETALFYITPPKAGDEDLEDFLSRIECFNPQQREVFKTVISLYICDSFLGTDDDAYLFMPTLMRAVTFWGYNKNAPYGHAQLG